MSGFKKFVSYYRPYKLLLSADIVCALIISAIDLVFPLIVRYLQSTVYVLDDGRVILY